MSSRNISVMDEIRNAEYAIKDTYKRIKSLEEKLQSDTVPAASKINIKKDLIEVKKLLKTHEDQLSHLRTHNRQSFVIAVGLVFIVFVLYMFYILMFNKNS